MTVSVWMDILLTNIRSSGVWTMMNSGCGRSRGPLLPIDTMRFPFLFLVRKPHRTTTATTIGNSTTISGSTGSTGTWSGWIHVVDGWIWVENENGRVRFIYLVLFTADDLVYV